MEGFLSGCGFTDHRIFFQSLNRDIFANENKPNQGKYGDGAKIAQIKNYRDFVFQVCPRLNYEYHKEYRKLKKQLARLKLIPEKAKTQQQKQVISEIEEELEEAKQKLVQEHELNQNQIQNFKYIFSEITPLLPFPSQLAPPATLTHTFTPPIHA